MLPIQPGTPGEPLLFSISALGSFTCVAINGTNGFTSHPMDESMVKCLALRTQVSRQGIRIYTLLIRNTRIWIRCSEPLGHDTLNFETGPWSETIVHCALRSVTTCHIKFYSPLASPQQTQTATVEPQQEQRLNETSCCTKIPFSIRSKWQLEHQKIPSNK